MIEDLSTEQLIERGRQALEHDEYALALAHLRPVVAREPQYADVHNLVGICLTLVGEPEAAIGSFDRAVELNPRYVEALVNRALTLLELGRYEEGRSSFEAASEVDVEEGVGRLPSVLAGRLANKHMELGDLYAEGGSLEEAGEQYRRALQLRPRFADIRNKLGRTLLDAGSGDAALTELQRTLEINPYFVDARINLGLAWYRMGDREQARREWLRCREQRPAHPQVTSYLGMLERGK